MFGIARGRTFSNSSGTNNNNASVEEETVTDGQQQQALLMKKHETFGTSTNDDDDDVMNDGDGFGNTTTTTTTNNNVIEVGQEQHGANKVVLAGARAVEDEEGVAAQKLEQSQKQQLESTTKVTTKSSLNSIYGNRIGFLQTLSMILNSGLMIYAHVGVSAVIYSNRQRIDEQLNNNNNSGNNNNNNDNDNNSTNGGGACNANDLLLWNNGGNANRTRMSDWCSRGYISSTSTLTSDFCLVTTSCNSDCFHTVFNYSTGCSDCLGAVPACGLQNGCVGACTSAPLSDACNTCNIPCTDAMYACTGLPVYNGTSTNTNTTTDGGDGEGVGNQSSTDGGYNYSTNEIDTSLLTNTERCLYQQEGIDTTLTSRNNDELYVVYTLKFFNAVADAWNGNAKVLAIFIVLFSGLWPYIKNIIIVYIWYRPLTKQTRNDLLTMLKRLGKYTLADVYAVIIIIVGVLITATIEQVPVIVTAEPRPAIVAFLVATVWEFVHFEWMTQLHHQTISTTTTSVSNSTIEQEEQKVETTTNNHNNSNNNQIQETSPTHNISSGTNTAACSSNETKNVLSTLYFRKGPHNHNNISTNDQDEDVTVMVCKNQFGLQVFVTMLIVLVIVSFSIGSSYELANFTTITGTDPVGCTKSYTLYSLGTELISTEFLNGNTSKPSTWTLFIGYIVLLVICPFITLIIQCCILFVFENRIMFQSVTNNNNNNRTSTTLVRTKMEPTLCRIADISSSFASIEVLLLALILVTPKFEELIDALAGEANAVFFGLTTSLGNGFYILIGYCISGSILQYIFNHTVHEYYQLDPYHKIHWIWTRLLYLFLKDKHTTYK